MLYTIKSNDLTVTVSTFGAELQSVRYHGKEKLWQNENGAWNGHAPVLFPMGGHCGVTVNGVSYPIPPHGFAPRSEFSVTSVSDDAITLTLCDSEETRRVFPYSFIFSVIYSVKENALSITYHIENPSDNDLYTFAGGHESFTLTEPLGTHTLIFPETEHFLHHFHDAGGYMTGKTKDFGKGTRFPIPPEYLQNGDTLIFPSIKSDHVTLVDGNGEKVVCVAFPGFKNLLLWRPDGANMICIEPWMNLPDPADSEDIPFSDKPNVLRIAPHDVLSLPRTLTYYK